MIIDEIQYAPHLLSYIKTVVDKDRHVTGQFILTGSQIFQMMKGVSESLAGRVDIFNLYPLTWDELIKSGRAKSPPNDYHQLIDFLYRGFYPEVHVNPHINPAKWHQNYTQTYIERDVRDIQAIESLTRFQTFIRMLASRVGSLLNLSEIAKEMGISTATAKSWLSILETTYIVHLLHPYHNNRSKQLTKAPKVYFYDTGLLCYHLGIVAPEHLGKSPFCPAVFENMFVIEALKKLETYSVAQKCYFYRTRHNLEVDLVIAGAEVSRAYEVKFSANLSSKMIRGLSALSTQYPNVKQNLVSLAEDFPGIPNHEAVLCPHWYEALQGLSLS